MSTKFGVSFPEALGGPTQDNLEEETMSESTPVNTIDPRVSADGSHVLGSGAPAADARPVGHDDRAVIAVFSDIEATERAVRRLAAEGYPLYRVSIVGKDLQSQVRVNGVVTAGDIAGPSAATGAWVGGLFGVLSGLALLFIPGAGPLIVLGPLAAGAVGAAEGALIGGAVGALLGHFVAKQHLPKYESLVRAGSYLVVVHGTEEDVARARLLLIESGSTDVQRHDDHRGSIDQIGPIEKILEGMPVIDSEANEIGKVVVVKTGDPDAVTTVGQDVDKKPAVAPPFADRLVRIGYLKVDRKGLFARDVYVAATEIDHVEEDAVYGDKVILNVPENMLLAEGV
jgi:hypothetical protein